MSFCQCSVAKSVSNIKVEENGKKAVINSPQKLDFLVTRIDGCIIKGATSADYLVTKCSTPSSVIVELKGKGADHASKQVIETAVSLNKMGILPKSISSLVVCTQVPRIDTTIQRAKLRFAKQFGGPMHFVTKNYEFEFDHLMSFRGPHRQ